MLHLSFASICGSGNYSKKIGKQTTGFNLKIGIHLTGAWKTKYLGRHTRALEFDSLAMYHKWEDNCSWQRIIIAEGLIWTVTIWCLEQSLFKLFHNHCPINITGCCLCATYEWRHIYQVLCCWLITSNLLYQWRHRFHSCRSKDRWRISSAANSSGLRFPKMLEFWSCPSPGRPHRPSWGRQTRSRKFHNCKKRFIHSLGMQQKLLSYFVRGSIANQLTSCLTGWDTKLL